MPISETVYRLRHAYQVLGVSPTSTALAIKHAHRKLIKRWHPDLYPIETAAHAEALQMSKAINEAYAQIANAPLRYYRDPTNIQTSKPYTIFRKPYDARSNYPEIPPDTDRIEYWVRFFCGAIAGGFLCLEFSRLDLIFTVEALKTVFIIGTVFSLCLAFASARYGDKVWQRIFRRWYYWS